MSDFWWSPENVERLKELWPTGKSAEVIAKEMGASSRNSIIGKVHRLGLPLRGHSMNGGNGKRAGARSAAQLRERARAAKRFARPTVKKEYVVDLFGRSEPLPPPSETDIARVTFADFDHRKHCSFIPGDPRDQSGPLFCGAPKVPGLSYCIDHARRCFQTPAVSVRVFEPTTKELEHA